jgi:hypothetical protein
MSWRGPGWDRRAAQVRRNAKPTDLCHFCNQPLGTGPLDADHLRPGDPHSPLAAVHATCNRSAGATDGNRRRVGLQPPCTW